jgi:hypothetical protein
MSNGDDAPKGMWARIRNWLAGLAAVLVVIPAVINSGVDVYHSVMDIPKTAAERTNAKLFKKYFNQSPVVTVPVPVKTDLGTINMKLSIYGEGDIYAEYGKQSQWFPFPVPQESTASLIPRAHAQASAEEGAVGEYIQIDQLKDKTLVRERYYTDGTKETYTINTNTGQIQEKTVTQSADVPTSASTLPKVEVIQMPVIDLQALRRPPGESATEPTR